MAEKQIVQPLDSEEIKESIVTKIAESIWESLNRNCDLYGVAYSRFNAKWTIEGELDNFGELKKFTAKGELPFTPPNVLRKAVGLPVPTIVEKEDGTLQQKAVFYKRERTVRLGREDADSDS